MPPLLFREIGWRINLDAIHRAFLETISVFPDPKGAVYEVGLIFKYVPFNVYLPFQGPTIFIGGADSDYIPVADHDLIKELFTQAEFKYISGAGHWVHSQKPREFLDCLMEFL